MVMGYADPFETLFAFQPRRIEVRIGWVVGGEVGRP
jgi:hypothetical protein